MDHGKVIAYGTHEELIKIVGELDRLDLTIHAPLAGGDEPTQVVERWRAIEGVRQVTAADGTLTLLVDEDHMVRAEAASVLADCDTPAVRAALEEALADRSVSVQLAVRQSLDQLGPSRPAGPVPSTATTESTR